ncbi:excisionase family DNA-binding protein [Acetivibrio straminisolvens]|jgi:excisionase family DNA binding protein|uniref:excisionase family DNA-binding protein n=1 Tax=Acetivibrio straminisolvens TaxID=253314 RepID=UPI00389946D2
MQIIKTFLKVREAVELYGVGRDRIYSAIHNRELRAYKPNGRDFLIKVSELEAWIEKHVA